MTFELTDEQRQLATVLGELLSARSQCRSSYDGGPAADVDLWKSLIELGAVAMSAPDYLGGSGAMLIEEVIAAEQLGAAAAAVPVASVSAALAILTQLSGEAAGQLASSILVDGQIVLCALSARLGLRTGVQADRRDDQWHLSGEIADALEGAAGSAFLIHAETPDGPAYFLADAAGITHDQPSLDHAQRLARIVLADTPALRIGSVADDASLTASVLARARLLLAAQAVGAADRALTTTVGYAKQRTAFGQPIGRFQAIKHPLADMLVMVENARSAVYRAAWSLDGGADSTLAVLMAKAVASENAVKVIHQAIQCHGGIGFTWEHDLHLLLRRAKSAELALGQPEELFEEIGRALVSDRGSGDLRSNAARTVVAGDDRFRDELTAWLDEHLPEGWGTPEFRIPRGPNGREFMRSLQRVFASGNWAGIHWPKEFGGRAATLAQQVIYNTELVTRGVPQLPGHRGLTIVGPTLIQHGTQEQRWRFLERIRTGDDLWAGGFSEPEAGSDLASLRTRGIVDGDSIVISGQKIWTSSAHWCNWIYTLVRTNPVAPKHDGISVVAIPLDSPGVMIRPIRQMNGLSNFNEVFFEDVRVPLENIIGPVNEGWRVNRTTLSHEHFTLFIGSQARYSRSLDDIVAMAQTVPWADRDSARSTDPHVQARLGRAWCTSQLIMINGLRNVARVEAGNPPGPEGSIAKVFGQEAEKQLFELAIDIAGPAGLLDRGAVGGVGKGKWLFGYLGARAATIGGGTSEIHRNKIAEGVLGLPRDLWADADDHA